MKKLLLLLSVITGCLGVAFADNHGKSNDSKDVEEVTNAVLKMYEMANNKKHWTPMISDKGSYQFWSSGGFLKHVKKASYFQTSYKTTINKSNSFKKV